MFIEESSCINLPKVNAKARLDKEFHRKVSHALVDRGATLDQAITRGLELWLAGSSTKGKNLPDDGLTNTESEVYSQISEIKLGNSLRQLLDKYGTNAVDLLAEAVLRMPEVSIAGLDEAEPTGLVSLPEEKDNPKVGGRLPRKRRAG